MGTAPTELIRTMAAAHKGFGPRHLFSRSMHKVDQGCGLEDPLEGAADHDEPTAARTEVAPPLLRHLPRLPNAPVASKQVPIPPGRQRGGTGSVVPVPSTAQRHRADRHYRADQSTPNALCNSGTLKDRCQALGPRSPSHGAQQSGRAARASLHPSTPLQTTARRSRPSPQG